MRVIVDMYADRDGIRRMACPINTGMSVRCVKDDDGDGSSGERNAMEMTNMEFDIHEMYISQSEIDTGLVDTFTWHLIADNIGLISIDDVDFTAQNIPSGTYNSLKIVFVSHVVRYGRFADDTTQTMEFESNLGENAAPNNSFAINYFGAGGSYYYDVDENEFVLMAEGENMPPYNINAGRTTTIYWKAGSENTRWTDITFDWIDCNSDGDWTPGVDSINNVEGPGGPMWTFMVVEE